MGRMKASKGTHVGEGDEKWGEQYLNTLEKAIHKPGSGVVLAVLNGAPFFLAVRDSASENKSLKPSQARSRERSADPLVHTNAAERNWPNRLQYMFHNTALSA